MAVELEKPPKIPGNGQPKSFFQSDEQFRNQLFSSHHGPSPTVWKEERVLAPCTSIELSYFTQAPIPCIYFRTVTINSITPRFRGILHHNYHASRLKAVSLYPPRPNPASPPEFFMFSTLAPRGRSISSPPFFSSCRITKSDIDLLPLTVSCPPRK